MLWSTTYLVMAIQLGGFEPIDSSAKKFILCFSEETEYILLFGFGLGSCDYSNFFVFTECFFTKKYEYLHYRWFSHSWVYLEQGSVGLILLISFFVSIAVYIIGKRKQNRNIYDLMVFSFLPTCLIGLIYNNALEMETAI